MSRFFQGVGATLLVVMLSAWAFQSQAGGEGAEVNQPRFVVYGVDQALPMLLDTQTGRSWYRQIAMKDSAGNGGGLVWTPVKVNPADTTGFYYKPLDSDLPRAR